MENLNESILEQYLVKNVTESSKKVYRSYGKKILLVQNENPELEKVSQLVSHGMNTKRFLKSDGTPIAVSTWRQIEKMGYALNSFKINLDAKKSVQNITVEPTTVEPTVNTKSVSELEESLRQKQAEAQIANKELKEKQEAEIIEAKKLADAKKEALIIEAKKIAEEKAQRENGFYPKGKALEIIRKDADMCTKPMSHKIDLESLDIPTNIPTHSSYVWLENERAMISGLLSESMNVFVHGSAGGGKSSMFECYGMEEGIGVTRCAGNSEAIPDDLFYEKGYEDGKVTYFAQGFMQAVESANQHGAWILVIEEGNLYSSQTMTAMHSMMDDIKSQMTKIGKLQLRKGCKLLIAMTGNLGYAGTEELTQALESRMFFYGKQKPSKEFVFANIWTEKVSLDVKEKFWKIVQKIESASVGTNHTFDIREPKCAMKLWNKIPQALILDNISSRWSDNLDDKVAVAEIVKGVFA